MQKLVLSRQSESYEDKRHVSVQYSKCTLLVYSRTRGRNRGHTHKMVFRLKEEEETGQNNRQKQNCSNTYTVLHNRCVSFFCNTQSCSSVLAVSRLLVLQYPKIQKKKHTHTFCFSAFNKRYCSWQAKAVTGPAYDTEDI